MLSSRLGNTLWIDATYVNTREAGRIVSAAVIVAVGVNTEGHREVLGVKAEQAGTRTPPLVAAPEQARLPPPGFIPLALKAPAVDADIRIELPRSGTTVNVM